MLKLLIIDDEAPARARLRRLLDGMPECAVIGEACNGEEALEQIGALRPDAILLDISMPGLDGMALARRLQDQDPSPVVIFCTAWPDRALDAFECDAVDYLLKPVGKDRLSVALDKARRMVADDGGGAPGETFLCSTIGGRTELIALDQVVCLLAEDKYTTVVHDGGNTVINDSLVDLEREHSERFVRVHRNALVARDRIRGLERRDKVMRVILEGCENRPRVSRRRLAMVRQAIRDLT